MEYNYEQEINIDPNALDQEWLEQPGLFLKYSVAEAEARKELDELKQDADITRAQLDLAIRNDPESYGLSKVTEATVLAALQQEEELKAANEAVRQAKFKLDIVVSAVRAMDHRRKALENLVVLHSQGYYSTPSTRGMNEQAREHVEDIEKADARSKVKRRRRTPREED